MESWNGSDSLTVSGIHMKQILAIAVLLVAASLFAFGQAERTQTKQSKDKIGDAEQELINLAKRWNEAFLNKDVATLKSIMAEDIVIIYGDGSRATRAEDIASIGKSEQIESSVPDDFQVQVYGDVAVMMSRLTVKGIRHGKKFNAQFRYLDVYRKRDERWQCVITQNTRIGKVE